MLAFAAAALLAAPAVAAPPSSREEDHPRPHSQALSGSAEKAGVRIVPAPFVGGKGGGVGPGNDYPPRWRNPPQDSVLDPWREYNRECTSFVAWALHSRNGFEMPFHKNANRWGPAARRLGYLVNDKPGLGSVAWSNTGIWGHVAYVAAVQGGSVTVEEYNLAKRGAYDKRIVSASSFTGFIHFRDLPAEQIPVGPPPSLGGVEEATVTEVAGGTANSWSDYRIAGGDLGPGIPAHFPLEVSCAVTGFQVADGNTWWYRIASSPWSDAYYATADAFYNNGQTSGSLIGTPFVDPAVRAC
jgi:surface antigen